MPPVTLTGLRREWETAEGSAAERAAGEFAEFGYIGKPLEQTAGSFVRRASVGLRSVLDAGRGCAGRTAG